MTPSSPSDPLNPGQSDAVTGVRRALAELNRAVDGLRGQFGETLGVRRVTSDVRRLIDDLDELGPPGSGARGGGQAVPLEIVPDHEYDPSLWADAEDEGLGGTRP